MRRMWAVRPLTSRLGGARGGGERGVGGGLALPGSLGALSHLRLGQRSSVPRR